MVVVLVVLGVDRAAHFRLHWVVIVVVVAVVVDVLVVVSVVVEVVVVLDLEYWPKNCNALALGCGVGGRMWNW